MAIQKINLPLVAPDLRRLKGYNSIVGVRASNQGASVPAVSRSSDSVSPVHEAPSQRSTARLLAIDYGRRRIGLAISDAAGLTAKPLATIERKGRVTDLARIRQFAREYGVQRVIVGHPLRMDGTPGEMADEAARFGRRIEQALSLPVELMDERLTSWAARQWQIDRGKAGARPTDEIAAAILLEEYMGRSPENDG